MTIKPKTRADFSLLLGEILKVEWEDCSGIAEGTIEEASKAVIFNSFGLCVSQTDEALILSGMVPTDKDEKVLREMTRVPWRCVNKITLFHEGEEVTK